MDKSEAIIRLVGIENIVAEVREAIQSSEESKATTDYLEIAYVGIDRVLEFYDFGGTSSGGKAERAQ